MKGKGERGKGKSERRTQRRANGEGALDRIQSSAPLAFRPTLFAAVQAVKLVPQPQPPVAFGLLNVKPDPCIELT